MAGIDRVASENKIVCAIVIIHSKTKEILEQKYSISEATFPYIPGFLSYRESPIILETYEKITTKPDLIMIRGNGILHPRKFGIACHIGLLLNKPTIGIADSLLCGSIRDDTVYIEKEAVAKQVKLKDKSNPVIVSPGHMISLKTSVEMAKKYC
ncbi:MAG: endonuclease V, partial [Candidatus Woesearchaeota archaeon]